MHLGARNLCIELLDQWKDRLSTLWSTKLSDLRLELEMGRKFYLLDIFDDFSGCISPYQIFPL